MTRFRGPFRPLILCGIFALFSTLASGQKPDAGHYSKAQHEITASRNHLVPMRDGISISVDIFQPKADGRFPAILTHTPYDNTLRSVAERARWFARRGYVVLVSDVRGRYDSEGEWDPFTDKHATDGHDLVEWIALQPWSDGNVGMMGGSYLGWTQWWTASEAPPHLKAIAPQVAPPGDPFRNAFYQNGIVPAWIVDWMARMSGRTQQFIGPGPYAGFTAFRSENMAHRPQADLPEFMGARNAPWFKKWFLNNLKSPYTRRMGSHEKYARMTVPSLNMTGWFDANYPGSPMNYAGMKQKGATPEARRPRLIIGPWPHGINQDRVLAGIDYGPDSLIDLDGIICRWFDYHLKGKKNGAMDDPPVEVFVMGANRWYAEKDWPLPQTNWTTYYFHSGGKANSLKGDGTLSPEMPAGNSFDEYVYDPSQPTKDPFTGGHVDGPVDTRLSALGDEVLVYTTPPLAEPIEVTGPIVAKLYAATSARDTDWMMRLVDVHPDGYAALLCDAVLRARYRDPENEGAFRSDKLSEIEPNQVYEYTIEFWRATGNLFKAGHRIRIEVSSSYYPYYLPNLNTGGDNNALETRAVTARQRVYHTREYPSHVVLPVIPKRSR